MTIILFFRNSKIAIITGNLALLFSLSFLVVNDVLIDEAGGVGKVESYLLGYWLWLVSIAIVTTCTIIDKFSRPSNS